MPRRINAAGLSHIKRWEGLELSAYKDIAGVWTIGYGSTGKHVKPGMKITEAEAEELLRKDLDRFERAVERLVTVPLTDNQFAALVAFAFNVGIGAFEESTLLRKLNDGNYPAVPFEMAKWVKATVKGKKVTVQGLVNRRKAEGDLFRAAKAAGKPAIERKPIPAQEEPRKPQRAPAGLSVAIAAGIAGVVVFFREIADWIGAIFQ